MKKVYAIVTARKNSKSIKKKIFQKLGMKPCCLDLLKC